jgi:Tol biopolymer transport system component
MVRDRGRSAGLAAFVGTLALAFCASTASATFPGANGRIAFSTATSGNIHTIRPDGTNNQLLTSGASPSWSADGHRIAFTRQVDKAQVAIFTMRADGRNVRRVSHGRFSAGAPGYAPNGHRILYERSTSTEQFVIATMRVHGGDERVLARGLVGPAEYSPDGRRIVYVNDNAIWDMRPDGSHKRQLTHPKGRDFDAAPDYSPDANHIIFQRRPYPYTSSATYVMRSDGFHIRRVGCGFVNSPDGKRVAWVGSEGDFNDIFTGTTRCTDTRQLTHRSFVSGLSWQPLP